MLPEPFGLDEHMRASKRRHMLLLHLAECIPMLAYVCTPALDAALG
jgi:hypothetical protein